MRNWRRIVSVAIASGNLTLLVLVFCMVSEQLAFRFETLDLLSLRFLVGVFTPMCLLGCLAIFLDAGPERKLSLILFSLSSLPAVVFALIILIINKTEFQYFSHDRRIDIYWTDQGALGSGQYGLAVNKQWGPFFYKQQIVQLDAPPSIEQEKNGKVRIIFESNGTKAVRDLDSWLSEIGK